MSIKPLFAWYDLWVGAFWDSKSRRLYILPLPCVGVVIQFRDGNACKAMKSNINAVSTPASPTSIWTVYRHNRAGGGHVYVGKQYVLDDKCESMIVDHLVTDRLNDLRVELKRRGLSCLSPQDRNEPEIIEVWL